MTTDTRSYHDELNAALARHYRGEPAPIDGLCAAMLVSIDGEQSVVLYDPAGTDESYIEADEMVWVRR